MKDKRMTKGTKYLLIAIAVAVGVLAFALILKSSVAACEFICRYFVNAYQAVVGRIVSLSPINVFEFLAALAVVAVIAGVVVSIVLFCKKKRVASRRIILSLALVALCVADLYVFCAGFAYNRKSAPVGEYQGEIDAQIARETYFAIVGEFNALYERSEKEEDGRVKCPYTSKELREAVRKAVDSALDDRYYYSYTPKAKPVTCSELMAQNGIAGVTFLPTAEPGYNRHMPLAEQCFTIAHEYAHAKGVMRENEADVVATYALLRSEDDYLKYCAYVDVIRDFSHFVNSEEWAATELNAGYFAERRYAYEYWKDKDMFAKIGEFFNDLYLKFNGQEDGVGSYDELPSGDHVDTGEVDENGNPIFDFVVTEYTKMDRMIVGYYFDKLV